MSALQIVIAVTAVLIWTVGAMYVARATGTAITTAELAQSTDPNFPTPVPAPDRRPLDVRL